MPRTLNSRLEKLESVIRPRSSGVVYLKGYNPESEARATQALRDYFERLPEDERQAAIDATCRKIDSSRTAFVSYVWEGNR